MFCLLFCLLRCHEEYDQGRERFTTLAGAIGRAFHTGAFSNSSQFSDFYSLGFCALKPFGRPTTMGKRGISPFYAPANVTFIINQFNISWPDLYKMGLE